MRRRLLQVERYVAALTNEQQHRRDTEQARIDEQASANELLRSDLSASLSRVHKLEETVKQLLDKKAELTQQLAVSQERLADTAKRLASQEEEARGLQQHAEKSTAEQRVISDGIAHRAELEAEIQRLQASPHATHSTLSNLDHWAAGLRRHMSAPPIPSTPSDPPTHTRPGPGLDPQ